MKKRLWPTGDPGRFDLLVNGTVVVAAAGDGASTTIPVPPGSYDITEAAVPPTDASAYRSTVACRDTTSQRGRLRAGVGYHGLVLVAGEQATCTFTNVRPAAPAIAIEKTGPTAASAGDTLRLHLIHHQPRRRAAPGRDSEGHRPGLRPTPGPRRQGRRQRQRPLAPHAGPGRHLDLSMRAQNGIASERLHPVNRY